VPNPPLETERLLLRDLSVDDLPAYERLYADVEVTRFLAGAPTDSEGVRDWLDRRLASNADGSSAMRTIFERTTGAFVGRCGLLTWDIDGRRETEVGYALARPYWGKGYAIEAATAVRDDAVDRLGHRRLISLILVDNERSIRVAERLGMRHERDLEINGQPAHLYALEPSGRDR
jgi:ribosomal-protein-alanine N-acetyltransferase